MGSTECRKKGLWELSEAFFYATAMLKENIHPLPPGRMQTDLTEI